MFSASNLWLAMIDKSELVPRQLMVWWILSWHMLLHIKLQIAQQLGCIIAGYDMNLPTRYNNTVPFFSSGQWRNGASFVKRKATLRAPSGIAHTYGVCTHAYMLRLSDYFTVSKKRNISLQLSTHC